MQYASRLTRLGGQFIDGFVGVVPVVVGFIVGATDEKMMPWMILLGVLGSCAYYFLADGLEGGQSLGKKWLDIRVVDAASGKPCTFLQSFVRNLLLALLGPIDWVFIFGERHQRLGDMAAGTVVVPA